MRNKKLAAGIGGVTAVAAAVAISAGTFAAFSDSETGGVEATAGTLNLEVGGIGQTSELFSFGNVTPGQDLGSTTLDFQNTGSVDGKLRINVKEVTNEENGQNEPEKAADDTTENQGELLENLVIQVSGPGLEGDYTLRESYQGHGAVIADLPSGTTESYDVTVSVSDEAGNEIQSDKASFELEAKLTQDTE